MDSDSLLDIRYHMFLYLHYNESSEDGVDRMNYVKIFNTAFATAMVATYSSLKIDWTGHDFIVPILFWGSFLLLVWGCMSDAIRRLK